MLRHHHVISAACGQRRGDLLVRDLGGGAAQQVGVCGVIEERLDVAELFEPMVAGGALGVGGPGCVALGSQCAGLGEALGGDLQGGGDAVFVGAHALGGQAEASGDRLRVGSGAHLHEVVSLTRGESVGVAVDEELVEHLQPVFLGKVQQRVVGARRVPEPAHVVEPGHHVLSALVWSEPLANGQGLIRVELREPGLQVAGLLQRQQRGDGGAFEEQEHPLLVVVDPAFAGPQLRQQAGGVVAGIGLGWWHRALDSALCEGPVKVFTRGGVSPLVGTGLPALAGGLLRRHGTPRSPTMPTATPTAHRPCPRLEGPSRPHGDRWRWAGLGTQEAPGGPRQGGPLP